MVKSACGIEAVYMCFNGTGIWGGETLTASLAHPIMMLLLLMVFSFIGPSNTVVPVVKVPGLFLLMLPTSDASPALILML